MQERESEINMMQGRRRTEDTESKRKRENQDEQKGKKERKWKKNREGRKSVGDRKKDRSIDRDE